MLGVFSQFFSFYNIYYLNNGRVRKKSRTRQTHQKNSQKIGNKMDHNRKSQKKKEDFSLGPSRFFFTPRTDVFAPS
jgi:hypothetical protein